MRDGSRVSCERSCCPHFGDRNKAQDTMINSDGDGKSFGRVLNVFYHICFICFLETLRILKLAAAKPDNPPNYLESGQRTPPLLKTKSVSLKPRHNLCPNSQPGLVKTVTINRTVLRLQQRKRASRVVPNANHSTITPSVPIISLLNGSHHSSNRGISTSEQSRLGKFHSSILSKPRRSVSSLFVSTLEAVEEESLVDLRTP